MDIADLVARERRSEDLAVRTDSRAGSYSYEKLCTNAWKAGNLLRHYGVREGATVGVDPGESLSPPPLTTFLGAGLLGGTVVFDPGPVPDARALVVPATVEGAYDPDPGTNLLVYGDEPTGAATGHFEREVWSENPTMPPDDVPPTADLLAADGERFAQGDLLAAADRVAADAGLDADDVVVPREPLSDPGAVVGGVLAPLSVGATVRVDASETGTVGVGREVPPESERIDPDAAIAAVR